MFSPSSPSDTLFSVRSSAEAQNGLQEEKHHNGKSHDQVIIVNRKKQSDDMSFSDNAEIIISSVKPIEEVPASYEKSFTFVKEKGQDQTHNDILDEELPPNSNDGIRKLVSLRKKKIREEIKVNEREEAKIEKEYERMEEKKREINQEETIKEKKKTKTKKTKKKKVEENHDEKEKQNKEFNLKDKEKLRMEQGNYLGESTNESLDKPKLSSKGNKKAVKTKGNIMDLRKLVIHNHLPPGPSGLTDRSDISPRWTYDPSLQLSGVTESHHILLNSPNASLTNVQQIDGANTATEFHFRETTEAVTKNSSRKSTKKHKKHNKSQKEEEKVKEKREENTVKEKKKFKSKRHKKANKEDGNASKKDSHPDENDDDEEGQEKTSKSTF